MKAEDIRRRLAELALDTNEYRINAGGAMVLHGLREETHDLDIWCTKKLGDALAQRCDVQVLPDGTRRFVPAPDVEIYENMLPGETVFLNDIPVAPLEDVLALKRQLNREKDQRDIAVLEAAIVARRAAVTLAPIAPEDIAACTELYNYYIENTCITLEEEPVTPEKFGARAARITKDYPYIVARDGAGKPIGFAYLDKLIIHFKNTIARIRKTAHNGTAARSIHRGGFLPNNSSHIIHTKGFTKTNYLCSDRNNFISAVINRTSKLIPNIDAQSASIRKDTIAFFPHQI